VLVNPPSFFVNRYSPVSFADQQGFFELLVKGYPPRPVGHPPVHGAPGGLSQHLIQMKVGDKVEMTVKPPRKIHGKEYVAEKLTLTACI
jgi:hypothetical protein